jgi:hypothetical protein
MFSYESFHDQGAHCACAPGPSVRSATRDISSDVPVKYDTRRYLNSLKGMISLLTVYVKVWFALIQTSTIIWRLRGRKRNEHPDRGMTLVSDIIKE